MFLASAIGVYFFVHPEMKSRLEGFAVLWAQLLSVTTFTLTFFLNVSYNLWRKCYLVSRRLQGEKEQGRAGFDEEVGRKGWTSRVSRGGIPLDYGN